jgi:trans-aconitate 2-methyltransferase
VIFFLNAVMAKGDRQMTWNPEQYLKFAAARQRPALDLLARLAGEPARIVDLGCGAGNITRLLAERWPHAQITGVDSDPAMLAKAAASASAICWQSADIAAWQGEQPLDLVFSNAALHWLGDHQHLLLRLVEQLAVGGVLAVQMPSNFAAPSHRILLELAGDPGWRSGLRRRPPWRCSDGSRVSRAVDAALSSPGRMGDDLFPGTRR